MSGVCVRVCAFVCILLIGRLSRDDFYAMQCKCSLAYRSAYLRCEENQSKSGTGVQTERKLNNSYFPFAIFDLQTCSIGHPKEHKHGLENIK